MGNSAVAVLHYDMHDIIKDISPRMADAMIKVSGGMEREDFGFGNIISWDHSSGYQVCVIYGNTGWRIGHDNDVPDDVMNSVIGILKMRGWKCTPPKKDK